MGLSTTQLQSCGPLRRLFTWKGARIQIRLRYENGKERHSIRYARGTCLAVCYNNTNVEEPDDYT
ncbi:hypothetical protein SK128_018213 [Halocaridina rubra]|uniref:Uncharacterized protein n=1 Tax=Halocaridina rubra TaxID=373956 RepID=A0AAN8WBU6_HALRR